MKIGVIGLRSLEWEGGIESYCNYIYPHFDTGPGDVVFYTRRRYGLQRQWNGAAVVACPAIAAPGLETITYALVAFWRAWLSERVDVIHVHAVGPGLLLPLARLAGMGTVVRHVGADWKRPKWGVLGRLVLRMADLFVGRFADVVVCLDDTSAQEFSRRTRARAEIVVIPNAVPKPAAQPLPAALPGGLEPMRYILSVSRIAEEKGILELIEAYAVSRLHDKGIGLAIAGEVEGGGGYKRAVRRCAAATPGCILLGRQNRAQVHELMVCSRVYVSASIHEGMSFSTLEALSRGCSCLLSDIRENRGVGRDHATYFRLGSRAVLTRALERMCDAPPDPVARAMQSRDILARHAVGDVAARTVKALERAHFLARGERGHATRPSR